MTNKIRNSVFAIFVTGLFVATMLACAGPQAAKTGFLKDYSQLQPHPEIDGRHRFINPNVDGSKYNKFIVDPVAINLSKEGKERAEKYNPEDLKKLAKYFRKQIGMELKKDYQLVGNSGPGVMRIRTSISDVERTLPYLNVHPGTKIMGGGLGGAGAEMEFIDSVNGDIIAAAIDNQKGSRLDITGGLTWYGNAETIMDTWAKDVKKFVDKAHGKPTKK
jgi:hypothetical protein